MSRPVATCPVAGTMARPFSPLAAARFAGTLYVVIIVLGVWSEGVVRPSLVIGDHALRRA